VDGSMTHILGLLGRDGAGVSLRAAPTPSFDILARSEEKRDCGFRKSSLPESVPSSASRVIRGAAGGKTSGAGFVESAPLDVCVACEVLCAILLISTVFAKRECWPCLRVLCGVFGTEFGR